MKTGDLVKVKTKFHGVKLGTVIEKVADSYGFDWLVHIPNHWTSQTIVHPADIELISTIEQQGENNDLHT